MAALERWNDGRLDDLQRDMLELKRQLGKLYDTVGNIGVLAEQVKGLSDKLGDLNKDLEDIGGHPQRDRRELRMALFVGFASAFTTGTVGSIVLVIAGGHP